ncbi:MAG: carbohydrate porin [Pseudomonadota bacterium]|nr:carbohydrate porin [Pseudomonadota bacterium]
MLGAIVVFGSPAAMAADAAPPTDAPQDFAVHGQATVIDQANLAFASPYAGTNSLPGKAEGRETVDVTLYAGVRPWRGAEVWINPEIDQGFGLHNTTGVAGFPSGEAYKVGKSEPYFRLQRLFLRQTIDLGGEASSVEADLNQLAGAQTADKVIVTVGEFNVTDVFDTNKFAHDPRHDFLNWALIDAGTFDYAADAWGYTVGVASEWYQGSWVLRAGVFDLSDVPNSTRLDSGFGQFQLEGEIEKDYQLAGQAGAFKLTGFLTRGRMASFADAIALGAATGAPPNVALVRQYRGRGGLSFDLQQQVTPELGLFARGGLAGGDVEPYEFSDIDKTISGGLSLNGKRWGRGGDTLALAGVVNGISRIHQQYFAAGGLGILIGDGQLPHPGAEQILETYYDAALGKFLHLALDYQFVVNPAYNRDRGPVSIFAARLHAQF